MVIARPFDRRFEVDELADQTDPEHFESDVEPEEARFAFVRDEVIDREFERADRQAEHFRGDEAGSDFARCVTPVGLEGRDRALEARLRVDVQARGKFDFHPFDLVFSFDVDGEVGDPVRRMARGLGKEFGVGGETAEESGLQVPASQVPIPIADAELAAKAASSIPIAAIAPSHPYKVSCIPFPCESLPRF